jgi:hypothetical protein
MALKVKLRLDSRLFQKEAVRRDLQQAVTRATFGVEANAKIRIQQGPKTGRTYQRRAIVKVVGAKKARELMRLGFKPARADAPHKLVVGFKIHRASAPGESPASDSTNLANSIKGTQAKVTAAGIAGEVIVGAGYGAALEEGTTRAGKSRRVRIAARPYLEPALQQEESAFMADVDQVIANAVR